ncbi:MAG: hypothetical protein HKN73_14685 [Gemmatimonadetes bacterium]|nr:hypothetical protein [Gemmatimonadota bacterium]
MMRSRRLRQVSGGVMGVLALAMLPLEGTAQVRFLPQIGVYSAVQDPGRIRGASGLYDIGRYESTLAYGGAIEFAGSRSLGFRLGGLYASEAETAITSVTGAGCETGCPAGVDLLSLHGAFVVRPLRDVLFLEPYALIGGGLKRFDFDPNDFGDGVGQVFSDESEWAGLLGVGAGVDLGGWALMLEVADHFHWTDFGVPDGESQRLDDFFFTAGIVLGGR